MAPWRVSLLALSLLALGLQAASGLQLPCGKDSTLTGAVVLRGGRFAFEEGGTDGVAWGSYVDGADTASNFGQLSITTSGKYSDEEQMFAAGFLEGALTALRIYDNANNMRAYFTETMNVTLEEPMKWIEEQDRWVRAQCAERRQAGDLSASSATAADADSEEAQQTEEGQGDAPQGGKAGSFTRGRPSGGNRTPSRRYWASVCLLLRQFDGLVEGYGAAEAAVGDANAVGRMHYKDFLFVMSNADLYDVIDMLDPSQGPTWSVSSGADPTGTGGRGAPGGRRAARHAAWAQLAREDPEAAAAKLFSDVALSGKCSALVKLAPDLSDIWLGHSTWDTYTAALRIFKHYHFRLRGLRPAAQRLSFSSYPGELFSDDDFYLLGSRLAVLQTTNKIFNDELFDALNPHTLLSWQRVRTANWLARSGEEWAALLDTMNSGTYNNQYMVVDLNKFRPGEEACDGLLWVVEQIPGLVVSADMTAVLALGYWPSFNVPFFPEVYNRSGYPDFVTKVDKYGQHFNKTTHWLSYQQSPRSKIFRRDQSQVTDMASMKAMMRYNDWRNDPFSEGHPICAVCGRGDLDPQEPVARGCYDTKVTNYRMAINMEAEAVNGPTTDQGDLPPFDWHQFSDMEHRGQPRRFAFRFERMSAAAVQEQAAAGGLHAGRRGCPDTLGATAGLQAQ